MERRKYEFITVDTKNLVFGQRKVEVKCLTCKQILATSDEFGPWHDASPKCESGRYNHCTCDICF